MVSSVVGGPGKVLIAKANLRPSYVVDRKWVMNLRAGPVLDYVADNIFGVADKVFRSHKSESDCGKLFSGELTQEHHIAQRYEHLTSNEELSIHVFQFDHKRSWPDLLFGTTNVLSEIFGCGVPKKTSRNTISRMMGTLSHKFHFEHSLRRRN